ncbi:2-oxoglutarate dehydrogenase E1 component [Hydrogenophilus thermoluteolus]|nr:2-oxoglutarate dehydrogenase E1 component [Hydrogenophilus thermoluteolus]MBW7657359.1 2-oxoglutarate dehydrogenase E1 component [Hydrogenophilus thermoluteolus]
MYRDFLANSALFGSNAPFVEALYEHFLADPMSVPEAWRAYFEQIRAQGPQIDERPHSPIVAAFEQLGRMGPVRFVKTGSDDGQYQVATLQLINAHRFMGHRIADLDPLKRFEKPAVAELEPSTYGFTEADLNREFNVGSFQGLGKQTGTLREILDALRQTYCSTIGVEYMYLTSTAEKRWLQARMEPIRNRPKFDADQKKRILERLTAAETLERYLHTRYVGQKRFSLEGGESAIVALDEAIRTAGRNGAQEIVIGMAHRGRLNVLVNVLGKSPKMLFDEFEGKKASDLSSGDVKYHMGFSSDVLTPGGPVHLSLAFNPSHLEIVNPVVLGSVYARQVRRGTPSAKDEVLPILIHGDAAVAGQGVNQEVLNFSQTRGYGVGGTVHIVINNQIGFTTSDPRDLRSTTYCTDVFKMVEAPIFHVNGDDPEAVAFVTQLALEFRKEFKKDVVIDIVCFRKLGHNEQDEPAVTQPLMYRKVRQHPGTRARYAEKLVQEGVIPQDEPDAFIARYRDALDRGELLYNPVVNNVVRKHAVDWTPFLGQPYTDECDTAIPVSEVERLAERLTAIPEGFALHPRVQKIIEDRKAMGRGEIPADWGFGENLAYASLVAQGFGIRLSGEDVGRGTFFHRHAVLHDQNRERWDAGTYVPLQNIQEGQGPFYVFDSTLSEEGTLGFDYGYSLTEPNQLTIWEAQFGDFANGAQVVIDQFISSAESKWGRLSGITLLLPHGYEGQGPEHSSARIERYLQLSAELNWQVCQPTTAAQIFHLLRRQMLRRLRKPLVVFTPKSLLRLKEAASPREAFTQGGFQTVIGEVEDLNPKKVKRVLFCSGKVYYELAAYRREKGIEDVAIIRLEQFYPFPAKALEAALAPFTQLKEYVWVQEEPRNQGAWYWLLSRQHLDNMLGKGKRLLLVARPASSSPAVGYLAKHVQQQKALIENAFGPIDA